MTLKSQKPCLCGGQMKPKNIRGERWPYRDEPAVPITQDHMMLACAECGESWLDEAQTEALEQTLKASYALFRIAKQQEWIQTLVTRFDVSQGDVERLLGVSAGYLSKAQHQGKVLSPPTFRLLYILARDPYGTAQELSKLDESLAPLVAHFDRVQHPVLA